MIFNAHDDVWTNVTKKREMGIYNVFTDYHYNQYKRGGLGGGIFVVWNDDSFGIVLDVSHANEKTFWDICDITNKPIIASHSNCKSKI